MAFLYVLENVLVILFIVGMITQIILPLGFNRPFFQCGATGNLSQGINRIRGCD